MYTLLQLLLKRSSLILFLVLELICAILVINSNQKQGEIFQNTSNFFSGRVNNNIKGVKDYFFLNAIADSLSNENAVLRSKLASSRFINIPHQDTFRRVRVDSVRGDSILVKFLYVNAQIINNSTASANNYFTIDRGRIHGVQKSMGVVSANGVVGIVTAVSDHMSKVKSILNRDLKVSGNVLVNGKPYFGSLSWQSHDRRYVNMDYVQKYSKISKGDSIVTSGFSTVFPEGYLIGKVDSFYILPGNSDYKIRVKLSEDLSSIQRVYVAINLMKDEQLKLEAEDE